MTAAFTKKDVFLYFADRLPPARRSELERAVEFDQAIQQWFDELAPSEDDVDLPAPPFPSPHSPAVRRAAALAFSDLDTNDRVEPILAWVKSGSGPVPDFGPDPDAILAHGGRLVAREALPVAADGAPPPMPVQLCPFVGADVPNNWVTVRQPVDAVPGRRVDVLAVRVRETGDAERFSLEGVPLTEEQSLDGPYLYAGFPLTDLIPDGDAKAGDVYVYAVEPSPAGEP